MWNDGEGNWTIWGDGSFLSLYSSKFYKCTLFFLSIFSFSDLTCTEKQKLKHNSFYRILFSPKSDQKHMHVSTHSLYPGVSPPHPALPTASPILTIISISQMRRPRLRRSGSRPRAAQWQMAEARLTSEAFSCAPWGWGRWWILL